MQRILQEKNFASQPIINRTTKPSIEAVKPVDRFSADSFLPGSFIASTTFVPSPAPPAMTERILPSSNTEDRIPQVDRNLKQNAMIKFRQTEEALVENYIATTQKRLQQETEWEMLRLQKESTMSSEITAHLQEKEEQLIEILRKMEAENKEQVKKNNKSDCIAFIYFPLL